MYLSLRYGALQCYALFSERCGATSGETSDFVQENSELVLRLLS